MTVVLEAAILGLLQGLTEFLPISSSAHLIVVPEIMGWQDQFINSNAFDVMLHMGTLLALVVYFWRDLWALFIAWLASIRERAIHGDPNRRLAWLARASSTRSFAIRDASRSSPGCWPSVRCCWVSAK